MQNYKKIWLWLFQKCKDTPLGIFTWLVLVINGPCFKQMGVNCLA